MAKQSHAGFIAMTHTYINRSEEVEIGNKISDDTKSEAHFLGKWVLSTGDGPSNSFSFQYIQIWSLLRKIHNAPVRGM